jgi:hypothetical protein
MTSTSETIFFSAQKSSISCVSAMPPMSEPARLLRPGMSEKAWTGVGAGGTPSSTMVPSTPTMPR